MLFYLSWSTRNNNHLEIIYRAKRHSRWAKLLKPALNIALIAFKFHKNGENCSRLYFNATVTLRVREGIGDWFIANELFTFSRLQPNLWSERNRNWIFMSHILLYLMRTQYFRSLDPGRRGERVEQPEKGSHNVVTLFRIFYCTFA